MDKFYRLQKLIFVLKCAVNNFNGRMISETFCENKAPRRNRQRRSCTDLAVEVVDFVSDVGDVLPHVFAILLRLGRLHRLTSGSRAELLQLYICSTHCCT